MYSSKTVRTAQESTQAVLVPYLVLAALFTAALVVCNLLSNKFIEIDLGFKVFVVSAGILPYPLTFLMTDILSEFYGKKKTDYVVYTGFVVLLFVLLSIYLAGLFPAISGSPMSDGAFGEVFPTAPGSFWPQWLRTWWPSWWTCGFSIFGNGSPKASTCGYGTTDQP